MNNLTQFPKQLEKLKKKLMMHDKGVLVLALVTLQLYLERSLLKALLEPPM
jgi:hypothetical protein